MMNTLRNRVQLIGNLGTAPEIKTLEGGKKMAKLVIATNETYKNQKGEKVTETIWHNLTAWGRSAASRASITRARSAEEKRRRSWIISRRSCAREWTRV